MFRELCKSKIHLATVTQTQLEYEGSLTLDEDLLKAADILPNEKVQVLNLNNGERFETYIMTAPAGSGTVCLNGPAARLGQPGDKIIVLSYILVKDEYAKDFKSKTVLVNENNQIIRVKT